MLEQTEPLAENLSESRSALLKVDINIPVDRRLTTYLGR